MTMFTGMAFLANVIIPTMLIQWPISAITFPLIAVIEGAIPVFGSRKTSIRQRIIVALKTNFVSTILGAPFAVVVFYVTKELTEAIGIPWLIYSYIFLAFLLSVVVEAVFAISIMAAIDRRQVCTWVLLGNVVSYFAFVGVFLLLL